MNKKLVKRFYNGECSSEEKRLIANYFKNHPEELEDYFSESEWKLLDDSSELDAAITDRMNKVIRERIAPKNRSLPIIKKLAVAASFFILIAFAWNRFMVKKDVVKIYTEKSATSLIKKINETDSILKLNLPDGSLVELFPKSELNYQFPFDSNSRKITLKGIAKFEVFHDSTRPFTVVSREIATTALGTSFKVIAEEGQEDIKVQLYEGSVVIRNADHEKKVLNIDVYLKPGEVFFYNRARKISGVSMPEKIKIDPDRNSLERKGDSELDKRLNNWYMFNNQSLAMVFESLQSIYDVKIIFNIREIKEISFIGKVERIDSIEDLLNDIATLNNLKVIKKGKTFTITKK